MGNVNCSRPNVGNSLKVKHVYRRGESPSGSSFDEIYGKDADVKCDRGTDSQMSGKRERAARVNKSCWVFLAPKLPLKILSI